MKSFVTLFAVLAAAAAQIQASPLEKRGLATVYTKCKNTNQVALTFDDGPWIYETNVTDALSSAGAKGTFFVNGNNYGCIYDEQQATTLLDTYNKGHQISSHTWSHPDLTTLSSDEIDTEMSRIELALEKILGIKPALMRPPFGNYNDAVLTVASIRNQSLVIWDFDSGDSDFETQAQSEQAYTDVASQHPSNLLALNHETIQSTAQQVLPYALHVLGSAGYSFVTVAECLGVSAYQSVGSPGSRDDTWICS